MNKLYSLIAGMLVILCSGISVQADEESEALFSPEAPEPAAQALVEAYLPRLASGDWDAAMAMTDLRGIREYFLQRRLGELKAANPELTQRDLDDLSAQLQVNDLNPLRLQDILKDVLREGNYQDMTWEVEGYVPMPDMTDSYLVRVKVLSKETSSPPLLLGIRKLGVQWQISPELIERMADRKKNPLAGATLPVPPPVQETVNRYWTLWQQGALDQVYTLYAPAYRQKTTLLQFLQTSQELITEMGIPSAWEVERCRTIQSAVLGVGMKVLGSKATLHCIMLFRWNNQTWLLENTMFRKDPLLPETPAPAVKSPEQAFPDSNHLRPNLKPDFNSSVLGSSPAQLQPHSPGKENMESEKP